MPKKKSEHYVNNKELLEAMIVYRTKVEKSYMNIFNKDLTEFPKQERGKRWEGKPRIPDYLGELSNVSTAAGIDNSPSITTEIGRASCRERV